MPLHKLRRTGSTPLVLNYQSTDGDFGDSDTYTLTNMAIGTKAAGKRRFIFCAVVMHDFNTTSGTIDSVTIGGSAATAVATPAAHSTTGSAGAGVFYREVSSGTTATVVVTLNVNLTGVRVFAYSVESDGKGVAVRESDTDTADPLDGFSFNANVGDVVIGAAVAADGGPYAALSYLDQDAEVDNVSDDWAIGGSKTITTPVTGQTEHFDTGASPGIAEAGMITVIRPV